MTNNEIYKEATRLLEIAQKAKQAKKDGILTERAHSPEEIDRALRKIQQISDRILKRINDSNQP